MTKTIPKIVVVGGGTGTFTTLMGLKKYPLDLTAIVSMTDSGGSNRILRDEFGLLPTSDLRQAMVALSGDDADFLLRKLFTYRFSSGVGIFGMTFGNLFMAALTDILGSQQAALEETARFLRLTGKAIPVTYDNCHLVATYKNGKQVIGEHFIDEPLGDLGQEKIVNLEVFPEAKANPAALTAIKEADLIVLGPGDLYTSLLSNIVIPGVAEAIGKSKAKKVFVMNLMTRFGQTNNFTASDHLFEFYKYLKGGVIDYIVINKQEITNKKILKAYAKEMAIPVDDDLDDFPQTPKPKVIRANLVNPKIQSKVKGDLLVRSLVRHDPDKLAKAILTIFK